MYPFTRRVGVSDVLHGTVVSDPYRWLEAGDDPEVKVWARAEDEFARARLRALPSRGEFAARLRQLMYAGDERLPQRAGERYFYERRDSGKEKHTLYVRDIKGGVERPLIDPNQWAELTLQGYWPSLDGRSLAYLVSKNNSDYSALKVVDVATGRESAVDTIEPVRFSMSWGADGRGFYYRLEPSDPNIAPGERNGHASIRYHQLGHDPKLDTVVRQPNGDARVYEEVVASRDGRWLFLKTQVSFSQTDWHFRDAKRSGAPWTPIATGRNFYYDLIDYKGTFYVRTDDGAPHGQIFRVDPAHPQRERWKQIVVERNDATLEGWLLTGGRLLLQWNKDTASQLEIRELDGNGARSVELPALGQTPSLSGRPEDDEAFFGFESYVSPPTVYAVSVHDGSTHKWSTNELAGVDPSQYVIERVFSTSKDGTRVPMYVVHRRDVPLDGRAPVMMTGYGGFRVAISPIWVPRIYAWIERGGVFVESGIRGGIEYGEEWHREGMLTKKQNTFDDLIGAAEELIRRGWARPERLAVRAASNGGLTTAVVITQRPDLFRAAICVVPVIDVIRSSLFGNGKLWEREYGSPDDPDEFRAMFAYSPYHHVKSGTQYPSLLVLSADSDDRVDPMHARKFAAAMQAAGSDRPVLLKIRHNTSHLGAGIVSGTADDDAEANAFLLSEMGIR